jgi:hypothetical protein
MFMPTDSTDRMRDLEPLRRDPRLAVREDGIVCLICGSTFRQLTNTHLRSHGVTTLQYKQQFGYNWRRPLMCAGLRRLYAERAVRRGLASAIKRRPILAEPELRRRGGCRPITLEETLNRRQGWLARRAPAYGSTAQVGRKEG